MRPTTLQQLRAFFGDFIVDLMASSDNAHLCPARKTGEQRRLPFYSRYQCEGSAGVDVFRHNAYVTPGGQTTAFGYCFSLPAMVGHVVQPMAERRGRTVIVVPDVRGHWFPRVYHPTVRSLAIPKIGTSVFLYHQDGVRDHGFVRYGMRVVDVGLRNAKETIDNNLCATDVPVRPRVHSGTLKERCMRFHRELRARWTGYPECCVTRVKK